LILTKIFKIVATRCQILKPKCTKFDFGRGFATEPTGAAYSTPQTLAGEEWGLLPPPIEPQATLSTLGSRPLGFQPHCSYTFFFPNLGMFTVAIENRHSRDITLSDYRPLRLENIPELSFFPNLGMFTVAIENRHSRDITLSDYRPLRLAQYPRTEVCTIYNLSSARVTDAHRCCFSYLMVTEHCRYSLGLAESNLRSLLECST